MVFVPKRKNFDENFFLYKNIFHAIFHINLRHICRLDTLHSEGVALIEHEHYASDQIQVTVDQLLDKWNQLTLAAQVSHYYEL